VPLKPPFGSDVLEGTWYSCCMHSINEPIFNATEMPKIKNIAIIGGGPAGVAAAK